MKELKADQNYWREEITSLLKETDPSDLQAAAMRERRFWFKDEILLRAIIEFSNYCRRNCLYCGLRKDNSRVSRYRMSREEIVSSAVYARSLGYKTMVLQSGEDDAYAIDDLCRIVREVKENADCAVTLSIGERSCEDYLRLKEAGADRYLLKFETSDPRLFRKLKPDSSYEARLQCLKDLKKLGYQVGSGAMVGLPGQDWRNWRILLICWSIAGDIMLMEELELDMIGIGPFIAHSQTPLSGTKNGSVEATLKTIAMTRIVTGNTHLPATTAIGSIDAQGRQKALLHGANVIMSNLTPQQYRAKYEIYPNKICVDEDPVKCAGCVKEIAAAAGCTLNWGDGHSLKGRRGSEECAEKCPDAAG